MPIHDWTRVDAGLFHDFHQDWTVEICRALNAGRLPPGLAALVNAIPAAKTRFVQRGTADVYACRANRVEIQDSRRKIIAVMDIVSPGNKASEHAIRAFAFNAAHLIETGIHLLVVDLFPPSARDPQGIHQEIWDEVGESPFELPADKPLTVVAYRATPRKTAYVEPIAVGDSLPALPIFLTEDEYVLAPLEETYQASWRAFPADFKELLEEAPKS
jgi:hypothetical protein